METRREGPQPQTMGSPAVSSGGHGFSLGTGQAIEGPVSLEAGVVLDRSEQAVYWHLPRERRGGSLPDCSRLWAEFWTHRENLLGFAHSHPGEGVAELSLTDRTTFAAIEAALGRRLVWPVITRDTEMRFVWVGPDRLDYRGHSPSAVPGPLWLLNLRRVSYRVTSIAKEGT